MRNLAQKQKRTKQINDISDVLAKLDGVKRVGKRFAARCPHHDDAKNSLILSEQPSGKITIDCKAGCDVKDVLGKLNLTLPDLYPTTNNTASRINGKPHTNGNLKPPGKTSQRTRREFVCSYDYTDETGVLLYTKDRFHILDEAGNVINKEFAFRQPNGLKTLDGVRRVLYRLPEIVTRLDAPVLLCEGEKDADMLANLGYLATTSDAGAATWRLEYSESLRNRIVIVVIDHDKAGLERGRTLAPQLHAAGAKEVYTLDCFADEPVPDKHGKDVTDYFNAGATVDDFLTLITTGASF